MDNSQAETIQQLTRAIAQKALELYAQRGDFKTVDAFDRQLWRAALDLFRSNINEFGFVDEFSTSISGQLTRAWHEGSRSVGVDPREYSDEDLAELDRIIKNEYEFILRLAGDIVAFREEGGTGADFTKRFRSRIDLWVNRYTETVNNARIWLDAKARLEWVMGDTEEHCSTCAELNGIVAFAGEWEQSKLRPQNPPNSLLGCGGWRCGCSLSPTTKRRSARALNRLINIAVRHGG